MEDNNLTAKEIECILAGKSKKLTVEMIVGLAKGLGVSEEEVFRAALDMKKTDEGKPQ
jgi:plasmid maintenance system antidote protein VapI